MFAELPSFFVRVTKASRLGEFPLPFFTSRAGVCR
jgi:hypothetical protein